VAGKANGRVIGSVTPRLLTKAQAAAYCGISVATFEAVCKTPPLSLGNSKRLDRFDIRKLDLWIDTLSSESVPSGLDWLATWEVRSDQRSR
jgi:hypothetical protein